jgi:hypothetical protein
MSRYRYGLGDTPATTPAATTNPPASTAPMSTTTKVAIGSVVVLAVTGAYLYRRQILRVIRG